MTYVSPPFASLIRPPRGIETQTVAGGGLLMVATRERFEVANPAHMAAARAIDAAIAPLNALPWPADIRQFYISSDWGPRRETPEAVANRYGRMVEALARIDPLFTPWWYWGVDAKGIPFEQARARLPAFIAKDVDAYPGRRDGYWVGGGNALGFSPPCVIISGLVGNSRPPTGLVNGVLLETMSPRVDPTDTSMVTYDVFRSAMLAIIEAWDATWCAAYPTDLMDLWPHVAEEDQHFRRLAWMTYVSPRFSPLIRPPQDIETQTVAGGGLLMVATHDRFEVANPEHMAAARAIQAALAPLDAVVAGLRIGERWLGLGK